MEGDIIAVQIKCGRKGRPHLVEFLWKNYCLRVICLNCRTILYGLWDVFAGPAPWQVPAQIIEEAKGMAYKIFTGEILPDNELLK